MASSYDAIDVHWLSSGDFALGDTGDLADTSSDTLQSLIDQITIIASSAIGDWFIYPGRGATLDDFIGEPNDRDTGDRIHDRVRVALVSAGIVAEEDLAIRVVPVQIHKIMIIIMVDAIATPTNRLGMDAPLKVVLVYDTIQQSVFFVQQPSN